MCTNTYVSIDSPSNDERLILSTIPHIENTLSLGVDVPVTDNHFLAARATLGYLVLFLRHHSIASQMHYNLQPLPDHLSHQLSYWQIDDSHRQLRPILRMTAVEVTVAV